MSYSDRQVQRSKQARKAKIFLLSSILFFSISGLSVHALSSHPTKDTVTATVKKDSSADTSVAGGSQAPNAVQAATTTKPRQAPVIKNAPNCVAGSSSGSPKAMSISPNNPGLHQSIVASYRYTVFGNTAQQINNQIDGCTPVKIDGVRYAASTDYTINWAFNFDGNELGVCKITSVSVGLAMSETLPAWQPTGGANAKTQSLWNEFITDLAAHENGHAQLNREYAAKIYTALQNFPPTDCAALNTNASAKANAILSDLNRANDSYDSQTDHGATQGAVLIR